MSDPVSNEDIEDVLSSIRRLVSDEPIKGMPRRKTAETDNVERFVLTPAFRVADEDIETVEQASNGSSEQAPFVEVQSDGAEAENIYTDVAEDDPQSLFEQTSDHESSEPELAEHESAEHEPAEHEPAEHEPRQEEIDLAPYQSEKEWQEPVPDENDRSIVEHSEEASENHAPESVEEPLVLEAAANEDVAPESVDHPGVEEAEIAQPAVEHHVDIPADETGSAEHQASSDENQGQAHDAQDHEASDEGIEALFSETDPEPSAETDADASFENTTDTEEGETEPSDAQAEMMKLADAGQDSLEQRIAELEAALQNSAQEWEPDGSEAELTDETRPLALDASIDEDGLAEAIASVAETLENTDAASDTDWQPVTNTDEPAPIDTLYTKEEPALESPDPSEDLPLEALQQQPVEWQDLEQERDAALAESLRADAEMELSDAEAQHNTSAMQAEALAAAQIAAKAAKENDLFAADEPMMLDEEALQELVADIVRQELQGVLGERITRNVRRLVRREIKRALAMRDLE